MNRPAGAGPLSVYIIPRPIGGMQEPGKLIIERGWIQSGRSRVGGNSFPPAEVRDYQDAAPAGAPLADSSSVGFPLLFHSAYPPGRLMISFRPAAWSTLAAIAERAPP